MIPVMTQGSGRRLNIQILPPNHNRPCKGPATSIMVSSITHRNIFNLVHDAINIIYFANRWIFVVTIVSSLHVSKSCLAQSDKNHKSINHTTQNLPHA